MERNIHDIAAIAFMQTSLALAQFYFRTTRGQFLVSWTRDNSKEKWRVTVLKFQQSAFEQVEPSAFVPIGSERFTHISPTSNNSRAYLKPFIND